MDEIAGHVEDAGADEALEDAKRRHPRPQLRLTLRLLLVDDPSLRIRRLVHDLRDDLRVLDLVLIIWHSVLLSRREARGHQLLLDLDRGGGKLG